MTATNHTEHYGLSQYTEDDRPTYTGDYNGDMSKIDTAIYAASQSGGLTAVAHTDDLTGDGSAGNPLGVADTIPRTESVTQAIAAAIADRLTAVAHDNTLTGDGTTATPLGVVNGTALQSIPARAADLNVYETNGFYYLTGTCRNTPKGDVDTNGILFVQRSGFDRFQVLITSWLGVTTRKIYYRTGNKNPTMVWSDWQQVAVLTDIPDVSALTSRIAALESQVSALTATAAPSTTGLTAEALDTQYSDNYNIVRTATAADSKE